ncbi:DUF4403 family protein [Polymorphobacter fuscus]|uniref:DUF4403 family protein n=1 Tax=Sandarakinorhabdus fusca TaxID=1439888 RepID=A0A7C9GNA3_9SPHN|nr:DUF4403 family protein [Polymorphobacter fuscus]KAB7648537.1 DUF4403 family protein [Polymorphobacter fuscus]MQT16076.1 DUF4403 family protein [Polymorphobacter fuscus]NJC07645.1 hypothetical protein [Polymorphobacter fuscus]
MLGPVVVRRLAPFVLLVLLAACSRNVANPEPARVTTPLLVPAQASTIAIPVTARIAELERLLNDRVPARITSTDAQQAACAGAGVAARIGCQFTGSVDRGPIRVTGIDGNVLLLSVPVSGTVVTRLTGSTPVAAAAEVEARVALDIVGDWQPVADVAVTYRWTRAPDIDVLGRRISVAAAADPLLAGLIARLEAAVPECLEKLQPRARLAAAWRQGFTVVPVNPAAPQVWLRVTPQQLHFANYAIADGALTLGLGATALTETFVGTQPAAPAATPLPPPAAIPADGLSAFRAHVPVVADYTGLEAIVAAALKNVESPPLAVRGLGDVQPEFGAVRIHATDGGRLAIGLTMTASTRRQWIRPRGTVWITLKPYNRPGSQVLEIRDVAITGSPDSASFRILLAVARSRVVRDQLARALSQDLTASYQAALGNAGTALADRRLGDFRLSVGIDAVTNGTLVAAGQGLYLPVDARGTATLRFDPVRG